MGRQKKWTKRLLFGPIFLVIFLIKLIYFVLNRSLQKLTRLIKRLPRFSSKLVNLFFVFFVPVFYFDPFLGKRLDLKKVLSGVRPVGISGFMRLRNEEDFVVEVVESVIDGLDELVIVFNDCNDSTPKLVEGLAAKYSNKIKVFDYKPKVFPQGSKEFYDLPSDSVHNLVNYYNFALAQTKYKYAVKIDGDDLFLKEKFKEITNKIRKNGLDHQLMFNSINLWDFNGKIFVNGNKPFTSFDRGFFPVGPKTSHRKSYIRGYEKFISDHKREKTGPLFFHLKGMKADRGLYFEKPTRFRQKLFYKQTVLNAYTNPLLIEWADFAKRRKILNEFPDPNNVIKLNKSVLLKRSKLEAVKDL